MASSIPVSWALVSCCIVYSLRVSKVVPYSITSAGHGRSWSWFLVSQPTVDLVIKPVVATITVHQARGYFSSQRDHPLGRYQIILLGDRGTQVWVACPRPLCNDVQPGLEPVTCKLQAWCPTNSVTASQITASRFNSIGLVPALYLNTQQVFGYLNGTFLLLGLQFD